MKRLRHGLWALVSDINPMSVPPHLTAPYPAYVSFWSALARHGMIDQVPRKIYVASLDRTRLIPTAVGTYSIHHLAPEVFGGYDGTENTGYLATPEKALFDTVYVGAPRGGKVSLPELELPADFHEGKLDEWTSHIARPRLRTLVADRLVRALDQAARNKDEAADQP
ncbi:MAG: hypothetical protein WD965_10880 [Actinomycetota bacterium]